MHSCTPSQIFKRKNWPYPLLRRQDDHTFHVDPTKPKVDLLEQYPSSIRESVWSPTFDTPNLRYVPHEHEEGNDNPRHLNGGRGNHSAKRLIGITVEHGQAYAYIWIQFLSPVATRSCRVISFYKRLRQTSQVFLTRHYPITMPYISQPLSPTRKTAIVEAVVVSHVAFTNSPMCFLRAVNKTSGITAKGSWMLKIT